MFGPFPIATPRFGDAINGPGAHTKRYRRELSIPCETRTCAITFPPDVEVYSLQDALFFSPALSFIVDCPPGQTCAPGTYPRVVTFPEGTFVLPPPSNPGFPITMSLQGCQSTVTRVLPANATNAQIQVAANSILTEVARQQAECDSVTSNPQPPTPFYTNEATYSSVTCPEGEVLTYDGVLPWYITIDTDNNRLVLAVGVFAADTLAQANAAAQTFLDNFKATALANDDLVCVACEITTASPLPDGTVSTVYSQALAATGIVGTPVWSITDGSLPDGLSLDSSTGVISGTPTTEQTSNFTVAVTSGEQECTKEFQIEVQPADECPDWASELLWGVATLQSFDGAVSLFSTSSVFSDTFDASTSVTGIFESRGSVQVQANLTYNGTGCNCNLEVTLTNTGIGGPFRTTNVNVINSTTLANILFHEFSPDASGVYNFPFSLTDTLGLNEVITVQVVVNNYYLVGANTMRIEGVFSNV